MMALAWGVFYPDDGIIVPSIQTVESPLVAVDLSLQAIRVCRVVEGAEGASLRGASVVPLPAGVITSGEAIDRARLAALLRQACHEAGAAGSRVALSLPTDWALLNTISVTCNSPEEVAARLPDELQQHLFPASDGGAWSIDYQVVGWSEETSEAHLLFAAIAERTVTEVLAAAREAGLEPVVVEPADLSLVNLLTALDGPARSGALVAVVGNRIHILMTDWFPVVKWPFFHGIFFRSIPLSDEETAALVDPSSGAASFLASDVIQNGLGTLDVYASATPEIHFSEVKVAAPPAFMGPLVNSIGQFYEWNAVEFSPARRVVEAPGAAGVLLAQEGGALSIALGLSLRRESRSRQVGTSPLLLNLASPALRLTVPEQPVQESSEEPLSVGELARTGLQLLEQGETSAAIDTFVQLRGWLRSAPFDRFVATLLLRRGQADDAMSALSWLQSAFHEDPRDLTTLALLTGCFAALQKPQKALHVAGQWQQIASEQGKGEQAAAAQATAAALGRGEPATLPALDLAAVLAIVAEEALKKQGEEGDASQDDSSLPPG
jgi:Tfp pilus assembly PilM family ATPase